MAFSVSRSQREIASNKYDLDLFNKKLDTYDDFVKAFNDLTSNNQSKKFECLSNARDNIKIIDKSRVLFFGVSSEAEEMKKLCTNYDLYNDVLLAIKSKRETIKNISEKMHSLNVEIKTYERKLNNIFSHNLYSTVLEEIDLRKKEYERDKYQKEINSINNEITNMNEGKTQEEIDHIIPRIVHYYVVLSEKMIQQLKVRHKPYIPNIFDGFIDSIFGKKRE